MRKVIFLISSVLFVFTVYGQKCCYEGNGYTLFGGTVNSFFDGTKLSIVRYPQSPSSNAAEIYLQHGNASSYAGLKISNELRRPDGWRMYHESGDSDFSFRYGTPNRNSWRAVIRESSGEYVSKSDLRFKQDVQDISYGLQEVLQMRPVSYQFKDSESGYFHLGFIAQEMETLVNESVITRKDEMFSKGIAYSSLIPVLVKAIQEQNRMIHDMSNSLNELRAEVESLKGRESSATYPR